MHEIEIGLFLRISNIDDKIKTFKKPITVAKKVASKNGFSSCLFFEENYILFVLLISPLFVNKFLYIQPSKKRSTKSKGL